MSRTRFSDLLTIASASSAVSADPALSWLIFTTVSLTFKPCFSAGLPVLIWRERFSSITHHIGIRKNYILGEKFQQLNFLGAFFTILTSHDSRQFDKIRKYYPWYHWNVDLLTSEMVIGDPWSFPPERLKPQGSLFCLFKLMVKAGIFNFKPLDPIRCIILSLLLK